MIIRDSCSYNGRTSIYNKDKEKEVVLNWHVLKTPFEFGKLPFDWLTDNIHRDWAVLCIRHQTSMTSGQWFMYFEYEEDLVQFKLACE